MPCKGGRARLDIGIYLVQLATMVFGPSMPCMKCVGQLSEEGVDAEGSLALAWPEGSASLLVTLRAMCGETAMVMFEKGWVRLHGPAHCPTRMTVARGERDAFTEEVIDVPLPKLKDGFKVVYPSSEGMAYEVSAVEKCIQEGLRLGPGADVLRDVRLECPEYPLEESLVVCRIMDAYRKELGVVYPGEAGWLLESSPS